LLAGRIRTRTLRASAAAIAVLAVAAPGAVAADPGAPPSITVFGSATRTAVNDTARLRLKVVTSAPTALEALRRNSARTRNVLNAVQSQGIPAADIRTERVSVERVRVKRKNKPTRVFYRATNSVVVTVRKLRLTPFVIDNGVAAGATGVSGVDFSTSRLDALYRAALGSAFDDAKAKAQLLADRAGVVLGKPLQIEEGTDVFDGGGSAGGGQALGPPIRPGSTTVSADVTVVFAIL
jgi:uncharacterized protein YggE